MKMFWFVFVSVTISLTLTLDVMVVLRQILARRNIPRQTVSDKEISWLQGVLSLGKRKWFRQSRVIQQHRNASSLKFVGLWEAAMKSMKHQLRRVIVNEILT